MNTLQLHLSPITSTKLHFSHELTLCFLSPERPLFLASFVFVDFACFASSSHVSLGTIPYLCLSLGVLAPARAILQTTQEPEPERPRAVCILIRIDTSYSLSCLNYCYLFKPGSPTMN